MEPIIFYKGEENGIVVETSKFQYSLFKEQYKKAFELFKQIWDKQDDMREQKSYGMDNRFSNIISFCGDRGEGKSSCMSSFSLILTDKKSRNEANRDFNLDVDGKYSWDKIELLDAIDPAFFDEDHNILELLLGRMFTRVNEDIKKTDLHEERRYKSRILMEHFSKVQKSMKVLKKPEEQYDSLENISNMSAGIELKTELNKLFKLYLEYWGKDRLILCVDDIDLNMMKGYDMAEIIRKYLINPYCVILVSVKVSQLIDIVAASMMRTLKDTHIGSDYCVEMAQKYVTKLMPQSHRVYMPTTSDFCDSPFVLAEKKGEVPQQINSKEYVPLKEYIVRLIYRKTGYVFYNTQSLSPIIPNNLRKLRHLIATLRNLPNAKNDDGTDNEIGRDVFKEYFFNTWASQMAPQDYTFAQSLYGYDDLSTLNKYVIEHIENRLKQEEISIEENSDNNAIRLYRAITKKGNVAANMSVGDVMFIIWFINKLTMNQRIKELLFFIRSFYSMRLYACYNVISRNSDCLYPKEIVQNVTIHKAEKMYAHVNALQRLVNGSYFTYPQNSLLPKEQETSEARDLRALSLDKIKKTIFGQMKKWHDSNDPKFKEHLPLCEYFALCMRRAITQKDSLYSNFVSLSPTHLGNIPQSANYAVFDFMAPFYTLCCVQYSYSRLNSLLGCTEEGRNLLWEWVTEDEYLEISLYGQMQKHATIGYRNGNVNSSDWRRTHNLISDAVIRIADVQWAILDTLTFNRTTEKNRDSSSIADKYIAAYRDVQNLGITLYPISNEETPWELHFEFLTAIINMLSANKGKVDSLLTEEKVKPQEKKNDQLQKMAYLQILNGFIMKTSFPAKRVDIINSLIEDLNFVGSWKTGVLNALLRKVTKRQTFKTSNDLITFMIENSEEFMLYYVGNQNELNNATSTNLSQQVEENPNE